MQTLLRGEGMLKKAVTRCELLPRNFHFHRFTSCNNEQVNDDVSITAHVQN